MIGDAPGNRSRPIEWMQAMYARQRPAIVADRAAQERVVLESGLDWTIVKPPRLADGPATGPVRADAALRVGLMSRIRRADLAEFLLDEVDRPRFVRARVFVAG
jgi:uncharacterized protein YbjT (DUF2867 family)